MSSPCIGWNAEPPCPVYGDVHGCKLPDGHSGRQHLCVCGVSSRRSQVRRPINHGTHAGYVMHGRRGEVPCRDCRTAHALYVAIRKGRERAA